MIGHHTDPSESEKSVIIPTRENENVTQKSKSAAHTWRKGTTLIVGDSMLGGVKEGLIGPRGNMKVRSFSGATLYVMIDYLRPLYARNRIGFFYTLPRIMTSAMTLMK